MRRQVSLILLLLLAVSSLNAVHAQEDAPAPMELRLWHAFGGEVLPYFDRMIADFNQTHPGIRVVAQPQGAYPDLLDAFTAAMAAGDPAAIPHLVHVQTLDFQRALDSGFFLPLANDNTQRYASISDAYGVPWNYELPVLYYQNGQIPFEDFTVPTTLDELRAVCETLAGRVPSCITWALDGWLVENWLGGVPYDDPAMQDFAAFWQQMATDRYFDRPSQVADWESALTQFINGEVLFLVASSADVNRLTAQTAGEVRAAPVPGMGSDFVPSGGALWRVNAHSPEEQAASQTFLDWLSNTENTVRWYKGTHYLPLRPLAVAILEEQDAFTQNPALAVSLPQLENGANVMQRRGAAREVRQLVEAQLLRIFQGQDVARTLQTLNEQIQQADARYAGE